jgi:hypothetical protein
MSDQEQNGINLTPQKKKRKRRSAGEWEEVWLTTFRLTGNVAMACRAAGIERSTVYDRRDKVAAFRKAWEEAKEEAIDTLAAEARSRAMNGSDLLMIFLLKAMRPEIYRDGVRASVEIANSGSSSSPGGAPRITEIVVKLAERSDEEEGEGDGA